MREYSKKKAIQWLMLVFLLLMILLVVLVLIIEYEYGPSKTVKRYAAYEEKYSLIVKERGSEEAFTKLKVETGWNPFAKDLCHQITHMIGRASAERFETLGEGFRHGDSFCSSGYYHGLM